MGMAAILQALTNLISGSSLHIFFLSFSSVDKPGIQKILCPNFFPYRCLWSNFTFPKKGQRSTWGHHLNKIFIWTNLSTICFVSCFDNICHSVDLVLGFYHIRVWLCHLGHVETSFHSPKHRLAPHVWNLASIGPVASEEKNNVWKCWWTMGKGWVLVDWYSVFSSHTIPFLSWNL